jgi:hypothetical protein
MFLTTIFCILLLTLEKNLGEDIEGEKEYAEFGMDNYVDYDNYGLGWQLPPTQYHHNNQGSGSMYDYDYTDYDQDEEQNNGDSTNRATYPIITGYNNNYLPSNSGSFEPPLVDQNKNGLHDYDDTDSQAIAIMSDPILRSDTNNTSSSSSSSSRTQGSTSGSCSSNDEGYLLPGSSYTSGIEGNSYQVDESSVSQEQKGKEKNGRGESEGFRNEGDERIKQDDNDDHSFHTPRSSSRSPPLSEIGGLGIDDDDDDYAHMIH